MTLSVRLLILVLLAAVPVLAIQVEDLRQDREQGKAALAGQALDLARLAAAQQDQFIESARYLLTAAAQFPEVLNLDPEGCSARMRELLRQFPSIAGIGAVGLDGIPFCSGRDSVANISIADRPYFQEAVRNRSLEISGYVIGRQTGRPHLNFAYAAVDAAGEVRAVVILAVSLERLSRDLSATPLPAGASISLIDWAGVLLASAPPAPDRIGRQALEGISTQALLTQRQGVIEATGVDGVERLYGVAPLFASGDLFALVGLSWQEAYAEADRLFWREMLFTVLAFGLAAIAALLSADRWIRRPVTRLQQAVRRVQQGDLSMRAGVGRGSSPELRELAGNFNEMARTLERRQAALAANEARFRAVVETAADGIITINARGSIESVNHEAERLFGYAHQELIGQNVKILMTTPDAERHDDYLARYLQTGNAKIIGIGREVTGQLKDGATLPLFLSIGEFHLDAERYFTGIVRDISERKRAEERQGLLAAEVDHRAKNLLATIQAMVLLTERDASSVSDLVATLVGRLHAMGRAHELLARDKWTGASLHDVVRNEFEAFAGMDADRLCIVGPDARLSPRAAQTLSLALHELTTNAAKHGALSVPDGRVELRSSVNGQDLRLTWLEMGGPEVRRPAVHGFGSIVVERSIAHELGGKAELRFEPGGLRCNILIPLTEGSS
jgi:PAS domain S-box-containing protein